MNNKKRSIRRKRLHSDQNVLDKAFRFYQENNYEKAEYFFSLALEKHDNAKIHYYRGKSFLNLGKPLKAISCFEKAKETIPSNQNIYIEGISVLLQLNFPDKALKWIEDAARLKMKSKKFFALKGSALLQKKDYTQAINCFNLAIKNGVNSASIFSELATAYFLLKDYKNAQFYFNTAYQMTGNCNNFGINQRYYEALSFKELGQYKKALSVLNKIPAIYKSDIFAEILHLQGLCYYHLGKSDKALFYINASIGENPQISCCYRTKAAILKHMNLLEESINCSEKAAQIDSENDKKELMKQQFMQEQTDKLKKEIEHYEQKTALYNEKLKENPTDAALYAKKAAILIELHQYHETIFCCNNALRINPKEKNAIRDKSRALFALGRYKEALSCINSVGD
ncbi:MAG: hypothetical protein J1G30_02075 [Spirochaetales bacterium]|nr:hypothetical protein [Spirochaetales bacterium]